MSSAVIRPRGKSLPRGVLVIQMAPDGRQLLTVIRRDPRIEGLALRFIAAGGEFHSFIREDGLVNLMAVILAPQSEEGFATAYEKEGVANDASLMDETDAMVVAAVRFLDNDAEALPAFNVLAAEMERVARRGAEVEHVWYEESGEIQPETMEKLAENSEIWVSFEKSGEIPPGAMEKLAEARRHEDAQRRAEIASPPRGRNRHERRKAARGR